MAINKLIKKYGKHGVYLWDPYLSAIDLLETVFFIPYAHVPVKALTSLKIAPVQNKSTVQEYQETLTQSIIELGELNLSFLNADTSTLGNFHDRFLIFPKTVDIPEKVWSLGTSVNSLGTSHHLIYEVEDGQAIVDIFEEMWNVSIKKKENIIWQPKK